VIEPKLLTPKRLAALRAQAGLFHDEVAEVFAHIDALAARLEALVTAIEVESSSIGHDIHPVVANRIAAALEAARRGKS